MKKCQRYLVLLACLHFFFNWQRPPEAMDSYIVHSRLTITSAPSSCSISAAACSTSYLLFYLVPYVATILAMTLTGDCASVRQCDAAKQSATPQLKLKCAYIAMNGIRESCKQRLHAGCSQCRGTGHIVNVLPDEGPTKLL